MICFKRLKIIEELIPLVETVAQFATPNNRNRMLRWLADLDQQTAQLRDYIDKEIDCRR